MDFHKKNPQRPSSTDTRLYYSMFFFDCQTFLWNFWEMGWYFWEKGEKNEPQATKKFFDPAIFQKCWRGSGRVALIAARRQRNPCAMLLAHGGGGEKSDSFSRRGEQDRPALFP
ncbi:MAG: hypothetical protein MR378_04390 [Ruminococcus sp.]|nr:hypothetical protein [Ruminococcus sp.]